MRYSNAIRNAKRWARKYLREKGHLLGRFKVQPGDENSDPGWYADFKTANGCAILWHPIGEKAEAEAMEHCHITKRFGGEHLFGLTYRAS